LDRIRGPVRVRNEGVAAKFKGLADFARYPVQNAFEAIEIQ
jgi:hypothetical protein